MASVTQVGYNASLSKGTTYIGALRNISGPSLSVGTVDMTTLYGSGTQSVPNRFKAYSPGLVDPGEISFECLFNAGDTGLSAFLTDLKAGTEASWTVTLNDGTTLTANAFPSKYEPQVGGPEDPVLANCALKVTGDVTVNAAT
jgi:hypothetical protein